MSHTSHDRMRELVSTIRAVEFEYGRPIGILVDLQGPKLRVGHFEAGPVTLAKGDTFTLDADTAPGDATRVHLPHPEIFAADRARPQLLLDDGKVRLTATEVDPGRSSPASRSAANLSDRKGVSLPDTTIPFSALAHKDRSDLEAALEAGIDWVALSFIQRPEDIAEAKKITRGRAVVMAKIEKPQAVTRLAEILDLADALMVARGDLGVEMPLEQVPGIQKQMTRVGAPRRQAGRGRDADARIDDHEPGADARRSVRRGDRDLRRRRRRDAVGRIGGRPISGRGGRHHEPHRRGGGEGSTPPRHHACATHRAGADRRRRDRGGRAADRRDARVSRPSSAGLLRLDRVARRARAAGVRRSSRSRPISRPRGGCRWSGACIAIVAEDAHDQDDMVERACRLAFKDGFAKAGQRVIIVAGVPLGTPGATNMLRIAFVGAEAGRAL